MRVPHRSTPSMHIVEKGCQTGCQKSHQSSCNNLLSYLSLTSSGCPRYRHLKRDLPEGMGRERDMRKRIRGRGRQEEKEELERNRTKDEEGVMTKDSERCMLRMQTGADAGVFPDHPAVSFRRQGVTAGLFHVKQP